MKPSTYIPYNETQALACRVTELEKKLNWHHTAISALFLLVATVSALAMALGFALRNQTH